MTNITLDMMRESLYTAVIADALDAVGLRNQSPRAQFAAYSGTELLVGRCKTTLWADLYQNVLNPYELELKAVDTCQADEVLICATGGSMRSALWGELLSTAARNRGCVGAVVDGAVRDVAKLRQMQFPVFARGTSVHDSQNRQRVIDLDKPVLISGVKFSPGDLVFADADGVVVVPRQSEEEVVRKAWEKVHAENEVRDAIRNGMPATEAYEKYGVL